MTVREPGSDLKIALTTHLYPGYFNLPLVVWVIRTAPPQIVVRVTRTTISWPELTCVHQ